MDVIDGFFRRHASNGAGANGAAGNGASNGNGHDEPEPEERGPGAPDPNDEFFLIGPVERRERAREHGLVLQSMGIGFAIVWEGGGWSLRVAHADARRAREAIIAYERENDAWPPKRQREKPRHPESLVVPLAFLLLFAFFIVFTGESSAGSGWFMRGRADSALLTSEPWRMITALTLHADAKHVLGNAISGSIFGSMVSRRLGPGGALMGLLATGALGNAVNALYHLPARHLSIGASTAVFGAIGLLAAIQLVLERQKRAPSASSRWRWLAPLAGGLALLGTLGSGEGRTDLWAHAFGFLAGLAVGLVAALAMRRTSGRPSTAIQLALGAGALAIVAGSWAVAMAT